MRLKISSIASHNGFSLKQPIEYEGFLCVITGRNGCGKTRLLQSIINHKTNIEVDGNIIANQKISLLDLSNQIPYIFSSFYDDNSISRLKALLMDTIVTYGTIDKIPDDHSIYVQSDGGLGSNEFKAKDLLLRAEKLLNKKINKIIPEELILSAYVHNEFSNGTTNITHVSLGHLVVNYYRALDKNLYLGFLNYKGFDTKEIQKDKIKEIIGDQDPHHYLNTVIETLFRGKFSITQPNYKTVLDEYHPNLIIKETQETIDPSNLSSGEKIIFWLAIQTFLTKYSAKNISISDKTIVLLDEPDSHLHPQMVVDFYDCLKTLNASLNTLFIMNTHSPTTVALCPNQNIFNLEHIIDKDRFEITKITKDGAISQLLEGVSQISLNPENNRQVYVENSNDSYVYEKIYTAIKNKSLIIDPNINLSFISSGPKIADSELFKHIHSFYGESPAATKLVEKINGDGNCQQVIGIVNYLTSSGSRTVRGLIDWDKVNRNHKEEVVVFAKEYAYSIENVIYDPISIYAYLTSNGMLKPSNFFECNEDYYWRECLENEEILQIIVDKVTTEILGRNNQKNHAINYVNGITLRGDREYYIPADNKNGHHFERILLKTYGDIHKIRLNKSGRPMIYYFVTIATLGCLGAGFVNKKFEEAFSSLQK